jgi:hypothetical protein
MLDSAVHHMAALRMATAGDVPLTAHAIATTQAGAVSSPDTIVGTIEWKSGIVSSVSLSLSSRVVRHSYFFHVPNVDFQSLFC